MVGNRRNLIYKAVIAINVCLLLYGALHLSVGPAPGGEWVSVPITEDGSGNDIHYMSDYFHNDSLDRSSAGERVEQGVNVTTSTSTSTASTVVIEERSTKVDNENVLTAATLNALKGLLGCKDREYRSQYVQRGDYWVLRNFVRAEHGEVRCHETITYTTHSGFEFLENVIPVVERWLAPVSVAIHAPGTDMQSTLDSINHLRKCTPGSKLVRKYVTFHIFFSYKHMPTTIPNPEAFLAAPYNCTKVAPYTVNASSTYKHRNDLLYPINVARNIAREAALTHYVFASDIELYPSRNIVPQFLNMIARNAPPLSTSNNPRVFPINLFEVEATAGVPSTKAELLKMLRNNSAIPFHKYMCSTCHTIPQADKWRKSTGDDRMNILTVSKRHGKHVFWEPIYIGTNQDPYYDERLSWEGMKDKMTQGYILCVQDYDFMILNNAFLIHKPGIKRGHQPKKRMSTVSRQTAFIKAHVQPELHKLYGTRVNCKL